MQAVRIRQFDYKLRLASDVGVNGLRAEGGLVDKKELLNALGEVKSAVERLAFFVEREGVDAAQAQSTATNKPSAKRRKAAASHVG